MVAVGAGGSVVVVDDVEAVVVAGSNDVVVVGGGPGGVCAAVGAADQGASVLLVERYGFLGGMATAGHRGTANSFRSPSSTGPCSIMITNRNRTMTAPT